MRPQHVTIEVDPLQKTLGSLQVELQKAQRRGLSETTQGRPATLRDQDLDLPVSIVPSQFVLAQCRHYSVKVAFVLISSL